MNFKKKKEVILKVKNLINKTLSIVISDLNNINSNTINDLRRKGRVIDVEVLLIRNTLLRIAFKNTKFNFLKNSISGNNIICFSKKTPAFSARLCKEFENKNENFKIKLAAFEGEIITKENINKLAMLPTLEEILSKLIYILKEISLGKFVRVLNNFKNKKFK
ncbi:50S ribosomal protein L10 [Enterobacteriaceae bacterium ET-AT1-13]|nr:50S ribosomal protein L10 [Enterobacteriaceae bacterium ET-AT1-13]WGS66370.1 50S ribosomal protein L10 [Enterobacteriaceae bacterium Cmel17]WMC17395.1 MAG: 50S ribosomal protein L10 [Enterobacteriaceae bacterium Cmel21]WMC17601.1 MAG: 50S ribosomal protein L10 [Enterobacteriaceae bacterium PSmelAO3-2]WMC17806.1 MAG: 50S ribosomal protein L10 [Enterobacteriaceae bacterium PSmelAO3-1]WMC18009.1 MAG: 50S ribosomal protein L10 [Enterobacteriaceae bacterium PSmelAO1]